MLSDAFELSLPKPTLVWPCPTKARPQMTEDHDDIAAVQSLKSVPTIMRVISDTTGMRWVGIAKVTGETWTLCAAHDRLDFGLSPGDRLPVKDTLCDRVRCDEAPIVIGCVSDHPVYRHHHVPEMYGFESYFSLPVSRADGTFFGTLCGFDPDRAAISDAKIVDMLGLFADLLSGQLDADSRLREARRALDASRENVDLREQFIAVLGHDIRTPLSSIMTGAEIVAARSSDAATMDVAKRIKRSAARIATLIDDVMDFARGKLGGGLPVTQRATDDLGATLTHVVAELQGAYPRSDLSCDISIQDPVVCDRDRVAQLLSNLVVNAIVHGRDGAGIMVRASGSGGGLRVSVANHGDPIPAETAARLFQPFRRGQENREPGGLGLGLYIACEIAKSHDGQLHVESADDRTVFTLTLPQRCAINRADAM